jgi:hypothetical protein
MGLIIPSLLTGPLALAVQGFGSGADACCGRWRHGIMRAAAQTLSGQIFIQNQPVSQVFHPT